MEDRMAYDASMDEPLRAFLRESHFAAQGGIVTDLDGTAVHELQGRIRISQSVEYGLKQLQELGRPLILNSLRFPLSVLRTFGRDWFALTNAPIPTISLNGSLLGYVTSSAQDEMVWE